METLNVKVEKGTKEKLERLVKARGFKNKSEAVRTIVEQHFEEHPEWFAPDDLQELIDEADKVTDEEFDELSSELFRGKKTAAEIVSEGRGR